MVLRKIVTIIALLLATLPAHAQQTRKTPYWASIAASRAMMRTGPAKEFPATWEYRRADLPIQVVEVYKNWRKIRDPSGTEGWMQVNLLSDTRTALVIQAGNQPLYDKKSSSSAVQYYVEPGVVGRVTDCDRDWCLFDVKGRRGYISVQAIYGLDPGEAF